MKNFTYSIRKWTCVFFVFFLSCLAVSAQQVAKGLTASNGVFIGFYEYKPADYDARPTEKFPLIIFLHGIGERGNGTSELPSITGQGIPKYISQGNTMRFFWNGKWETFMVLSPQLSRSYGDWQNFYVDEMYNYGKNNLRVDTNRIYLTGLSLGGGGVWRYASTSLANARKFAAIVPICGTCNMISASNIVNANLPVWAFHANDDGVVGVGCTTSSIAAINALNPTVRPLMTLYNDGNHFIWDRAYDQTYYWQNPHVFEWMLGQAKNYPLTNQPPVANAGTDIVVTHPITISTLNGSASNDPDGSIARYTWTKISGPNGGNIQSTNTPVSNITGMVSTGVYRYELLVVDNRAVARRDTVQVTVNPGPPGTNLPPVAVAGADQTITVDNVIITSWGSFDVDGGLSAYLWTKISGPAQYAMPFNMYNSCGITGMVSGVYQFELQITDNTGNIGRDTVQITVNLPGLPPANQAPNANAGTDINITLPINNTTLNGAGSNDPDGSISNYSWTQIAGPTQYTIGNPNAASTPLTNLVQGTYSFRLSITDNSGATDADTVNVVVNAAPPVNQTPNANAGTDISITLPTNNTSLNGSGSSDPDGTINNFSWSRIAGPAQHSIANTAAATTGLSNLVQGTYSFRLVVTDNNGATDSDTVIVVVNPAPPPPNQAPAANAGGDVSITLPVNNSTLDGSASSDADGSIASYAWTWISGPAQYNITNTTSATTAINNLVQGSYRFRLVVTDNSGATSADTVTVIVNAALPPANIAPGANAGTDINITLPTNNTTLNGTASNDPDGTIVAYSWSRISGPVQFTIANGSAASTSVSNLVAGTYSFRLVVTDNSGATDDDTVTVVVNAAPPPANLLPIAKAGADIALTLPTNSTTLIGYDSYDPDGTITSWVWNKISGPAQFNIADANAGQTTLSNLVSGTYTFSLTVTDNNGATASDTVEVLVSLAPPPPNQLPGAVAGTDIAITLPTNNTTLDGSASSDADGTIVSFNWVKIAGPAQFTFGNANAASTTLSNLLQGTYSFRLVVTDDNGAIDSDTINVVVNAAPPPPNQAPSANAGADISITLPTNNTTLNGSASSDPDGTIAMYSWTRISGPAQFTIANNTAANSALSNLVQGTYEFRLQVTDNNGATDADTVTVVVNAAPPPPNVAPVAVAGSDISITLPTNNTTLNGSGSNDPDGSIAAYNWSRVSGPAQFNIANPGSASTTLNNLVEGAYSFRLVVTDNNGATDADTITVIVNAAPPPPNVAPNANAGTDINITLPTNSTTLNGSASNDPDGTIATYNWSSVSGPAQFTIANPGSASTALSNLVQGTYTFRILVTDNNGATDADTIIVTVNAASPPANIAPVANAGTDIYLTLPANNTTLNGSLSSDADGTIATYSWTRISGPAQYSITNAAAASTALTNLVQGTYSFRLQITDNNGATDADTVVVTVSAAPPPPNQGPQANAGVDFSVSLPNPTIQLNGSASSDADGTIASYSWVKISGPGSITIVNSTTATPAVLGVVAGTYEFELTVTDNSGAISTDRVTVIVNAAPNNAPVARAGNDTTIAVPASTAVLNGSSSSDPDGTIASYSWRQLNGPSSAVFGNASLSITSISGLLAGDYQFELTVTDNTGASHRDSVSVSVVDNFSYQETLMVYPNPATTIINIRCIADAVGQGRLTVYNMNGHAVQVQMVTKPRTLTEFQLNVTALKSGVYYIEIIIDAQKRMITKFIKQ